MADVWRGRVRGDSGFVRDVAIKQMHQNLATQPPYVAMFVEEARVGSMLQVAERRGGPRLRPRPTATTTWCWSGSTASISAPGSAGTSQRNEPTRWELVAAVGVGILRGLAAAHERVGTDGRPLPVVHRDVSPHNVLLTTRGMVKLIDFGLALAPDRPQETTEPGIVKGKMSYLAPEIVAGGRPTPASDQFACGSVLWEALVGRKLFDGATDYETYCRLRDCMVQPLRPLRPDVPGAVRRRSSSARCPRDIDDRFPSTREMARQIGTTLKKVQLRKDLHTVLARSVSEARAALGLGGMTGEISDVTPLAELLPEEAPRLDPAPRGEGAAAQAFERLRSLRHYLPFFGKKRG